MWLVTWDPSQPTATRPLAIQNDGTWFTYGYDITKNVCELFGPNGYIRTAYSYTPFGSVSASENGDVTQPFQWSSEVYDSELDLVYYNYRHYSPTLGRFLSRDSIAEQGGLNLYAFVRNSPIRKWDILGKWVATRESYGKERRIYEREKDDTIKLSLAKKVGLDVGSFDKWASPVDGIARSGLACKYSVPNVWIAADLLQGGGIWDRVVNIGGSIGRFLGTDLLTYGFKIRKVDSVGSLQGSIITSKNDLWGMVVFGHGNPPDARGNGAGDYLFGEKTRVNFISQNALRGYLPEYRLSKVYMMQCYSAAGSHQSMWSQKAVSFWGYKGVNAFGVDFGSIVFPWNWF